MVENDNYKKLLSEALRAKADWIEKAELPKLKEELRLFHTGFASLYNLYLKKGLINTDPYKTEAKVSELEIPSTELFSEAEKLDQLTQRLANYDNQLDYLVNFYQFSVEFLTLERIRLILGLVKYIDWVRLTPNSQSQITKAVAEMTYLVKAGAEPITTSLINESLNRLSKSCKPVIEYLKSLTDYQRETYKLDMRDITEALSKAEASNLLQVRKKFSQTRHGIRFYPDLAEELIKEDYSQEGLELREQVLKKLQVAENESKTVQKQTSFKTTLIGGIQGLGSIAQILTEVAEKLDESHGILLAKKQSFMEKLKKLLHQILKKEPEAILYELEYMDPVKGTSVNEKLNYNVFRSDLERKIRTLSPLVTARRKAAAKLESMKEEQLVGFLERNIKELQAMYKTLDALDVFFKAEVSREVRDKIRGIKPELGILKNAILRANSKRHEYSARKEEEEQLKRLGVHPET